MNSHSKSKPLAHFLNTTACLVVLTAFAHEANAAPEGSLIVGGAATVTQAGLDTVIKQTSNRAIIKWNSFDVGQPERVNFQQPSSNSITINRITDTKASRIDGQITANGKLVMINPNGIVFGATSRVDVGSLVATTSDLEDDAAFMTGNPAKFTKSGKPDASIINAGTITAREAGLVGLVAPNVENSGVIQAKLGKVQLASGDIHTIDLAGDGLIQLEVSDQVLSQNVKNTGTIQADGGQVLMTAAQGRAALDAVISNHGRIQTGTVFALDGTTIKKGQITMLAGTKGGTTKGKSKIVQGGTLWADGGAIELIADTITLEGSSVISTAADYGGGDIFIGGARQGGSSLPTAQFLNVEAGSLIDASALINGDGGEVILWSDQMTRFEGKILSKGGIEGGNGGEVEVSSKGYLAYKGFVDLRAAKGRTGNLLLDPTDVLITNAPDQNISGSSPFTPTVDDGPSILDVATLTAALGAASVTVQTSATGSQAGNITVDAPITWGSGNTLTLDAHNNIIINQAIAGDNLTLIAGNDTIIGAALTGSGTLTIMPKTDSQTMGVGSSSLGTLQVNTTELGFITNGWNNLVFGRATSTADMEVRSAIWNDNVTFRSDTGIIRFTGSQNANGNTLSIRTNGDLDLTSQLAGSGTLSIATMDPSFGIGLGTAQTGALQLSDAELGNIVNGWSLIEFGTSAMTGDINVGARTWNDVLTLKTDTGVIAINGTQTMGANNLTIETNGNPYIGAGLSGSGSLFLYPGSNNVTVGLGNGAAGTYHLDSAEFANILNGWTTIYIGRTDNNGDTDIRALNWQDPFRIFSGNGVININGAQNFGMNQGVYQTDADIAINATIAGTGNIAFLSNLTGTSFGLAGEAGTINLTTAELNRLQNGFNLIQFGSAVAPSDNPMNVGAHTWSDDVTFTNADGQISINGAQNMGANNLTIRTNADPVISAALTGTGTLTFLGQYASTTMGLGDGQAGIISLSDAELALITNGWSNIVMGRTDGSGTMNVGALTWNDHLALASGTGVININGAQNMGSNNLTLSAHSDLNIGAALNGTGILTIQGALAATTIGVGTGQTGVLSLNAADLANIIDGWSSIVVGRADGTGSVNVGTNTWNDNLTVTSGSGVVTINGAQNFGANNFTLSANSNPAINAALTGTGILTIQGSVVGTTIGVGTGQAGTLSLNAAELANLTDGWSSIVIGRTDGTGAMNVGANTWVDPLTLQTGSGVITIAGAQTMGANDLTISSNASPLINAALTGTGTLYLYGSGAGTTMGLGDGQAGSFTLTNASIANITNGWGNISIGRNDGTGVIRLGALTWNDNLTLRSLTGSIIIDGIQTLGANNVTFTTNGDPQINAAMNSTGTLTFAGQSDATTIGVGDGQAGSLSLSTADLANADNTWATIVIGSLNQTGAINVGNVTLADPLTLQSTTGIITIGAPVAMGANTLTIQTDANPVFSSTLSGSGNFYLLPMTATSTIGIGSGQPGMVSLDNSEVANILNGWGNIVIGRVTASGAITMGPGLTWNDALIVRTTGVVTIDGNQSFGANNFTLQTDSDPVINGNLSGSGTLTVTQIATGNTIGLGNGQSGVIHFSDAELARIVNGWGSLVFGLTNSSGALDVGAYNWNDNLTLRSGSGIISINGTQNMGGNSLTLSTDGNLNIGGNLSGTGTLTITPNGNTSMGLGDGQTGTLNLTNAELDFIQDGWANLVFGLTTSSQQVNVGAYTWNDNVTIRNGSAVMTIAGAQNMGSNNLTLNTDANLALNAALTGTGTLAFVPNGNTSIAIGSGQSGALNFTDTELNRITDGWTSVVFGSTTSTAAVNVGTRTWNDNLTIRSGSGLLSINGNVNMGANNLNLQTDSNLQLTGTLAGTGVLNIRGMANATTISIGTGQTGTVNLDNAEIANITNGWTRIDLGHTAATGAINIGAANWQDSVRYVTNTGAITVNGNQNLGANDLTITTNSDPTFNAILSGSGTLTILPTSVATTVGIGDGQIGTLHLSNADLGYISAGWDTIVFGSSAMTGVMNIGAYNWQYDTVFRSGTGVITVNGAQNSGSNSLSFETDANLAIFSPITGTGILTIRGASNGTTIGIGTGQAGTLQLTNTEANMLMDGWQKIIFGHSDSTGAMNIGAKTWDDPVTFITDTGLMTIAGDQTMGANDLTFETNSNLAISANLIGTGNLTIRGAAIGTSIGINGAAGTLALSTAEIARIIDGWNSVTIGRQDMTADISLNSATWLNPTTFITRGNIAISGVQTSTETGGDALVFVTQAGSFTNTAGAAAINPGGGRYLIYAVDSGSVTLGGLSPVNTISGETYFSAPPSTVIAGDGIIYSSGATKILYIRIDDKVKVYGDGLPNFTYTYLGGLQGSDTLSAALTAAVMDALGASLTDNAGTTWAITGNFTTALGYTVQATNGTMTVVKAPLLVQANPATRTYGAANPALSLSYIGLKNGETGAVIDVTPTVGTGADVLSNVGTYNITTGGGSDNNYIFNYGPSTLTITKANLTITADNKTREYGDANPTFTYSYSGFMNGEGAGVLDSLPTATTTATNTTSPTTTAISLSGGLDNNYSYTLVDGTLTITKANLTVTANNASRVYGNPNPSFSYTFGSFKNGEDATVLASLPTASSTATSTTNAGTAAITVSGGSDAHYNYVFVDGVLTINKSTLTVTAQNISREYGDANPTFIMNYTGFKNSDGVGDIDTLATATSSATNASGVGTAPIVASGAFDNNYDFNYVNGILTITKANLTVTADNKTREYGDANPALTYTYGPFKNGETSAVLDSLPTISTAANATTNAGTAAITLAGGLDDNYNYVFTNGTLTITKANLTITAADQTREYGDANPALTYTYGSFKNGETSAVLDALPTISTTATNTTGVGVVAITLSGGSDNNYNYTLNNGQLTISKAALQVTADNKTREYGDANPALTYTYGPFKNGETAAVLDSTPTISTTATNTTNVGTAAISLAGGADDNYYYVLTDGTLTITKANLTITADDKTREYGDANPALTYTFGAFKNGETSAVLDSLPTISTAANNTTNAGTSAITLTGGLDDNYNLVLTDGTLTITKANLTITADDKTREYGDANPALTYTFGAFKNGETSAVLDNLPTISTAANNTTNVGTSAITLTGGLDNNYNLVLADGTLTITKATLTATAQNISREYGDANPAFVVNYSGFKNGEGVGVIDTLATASSAATVTDNAGLTFAITPTGANDNNYDFVYADGTLTIDKANLTVTADNKTREYGDANPALTYTFGSFKNGETSAVLDNLPSISTTANLLTNAGTEAITLSGGLDNNYNLVLNNGVLTITKAALTIQIDNATRAEGQGPPAYTYNIVSGLKNGDAPSVLSDVNLYTSTNINTPRGSYAINGSGGTATNYYISTYLPGTLTITPGKLPLSVLPSTVYYSNSLGVKEGWDQWRDLIYYEDDEYVESILFGRQVHHRKYAAQNAVQQTSAQ